MAYDLITVGRVNMDLFSQDVGVDFAEITGFDTAVGGSPSNVAIGTSRLGMTSIAFTAVGDDTVGDFVLRYLLNEGVVTDFIRRKAGKRTSLALVGVQPPDSFPLTFYRDDPADIHLTIDDAALLPIGATRAVLLSGDAFSRGSCADAAQSVAEAARSSGLVTFMDLDVRPTDWPHPRAFGLTLRPVLPLIDVLVGTEEEFYALLAPDPERAMDGTRLTASDRARLDELVTGLLATGTAVLKRGARGAAVISRKGMIEVPGFAVEPVNTVGAGDAFASGLIWGRLQGWDWPRAGRFANACGALVVTRHGCAVAFPTQDEVVAFIEANGGSW